MTDTFGIALAQINPVVGDIAGNLAKLRWARAEAAKLGADLVVPGELAISGYPPEDLVLKPAFLAAVADAVAALAADTKDGGPALLATAPWRSEEKTRNAALLLDGGKFASIRFKHDLPNYGVFDEKRVFAPGPMPGPMVCRGVRLGVMICEDMWTPDAAETLQESGAEILIVPNGSPFELDKLDIRRGLAAARVSETGLPLVYVNQVGGQDEVVFDGASFVLGADGACPVQLAAWTELVAPSLWRRTERGWVCETGGRAQPSMGAEAIYQAMMLGLRDYVRKNRFPGVILGLSGGIDSALTAAVAADAEMLAPSFDALPPDITEENLQSRARGLTLMALSNKFGPMVLSTGNKSEMSVGYATLYGDMCGGYAVLKDIYKMMVFQLARWRNQSWPAGALGPAGRVMPERVITKPPSAELKPDQTDQDTLPPYEVLDDILNGLIEREEDVAAIVARGHDEATVRRVWRMLDRAEYKRRQAPPGVKITPRAFGRDRRYPITNAFQG